MKIVCGCFAGVLVLAGFFGGTLLSGLVWMILWNWIAAGVFAAPLLTFWQAWGMMLMLTMIGGRFKSSHPGWLKDLEKKADSWIDDLSGTNQDEEESVSVGRYRALEKEFEELKLCTCSEEENCGDEPEKAPADLL